MQPQCSRVTDEMGVLLCKGHLVSKRGLGGRVQLSLAIVLNLKGKCRGRRCSRLNALQQKPCCNSKVAIYTNNPIHTAFVVRNMALKHNFLVSLLISYYSVGS